MMTWKYIFWDCDSTLLDNSRLHWEKHVAVTARHGVTLDPKYRAEFYHNNGEQNWTLMNRELGFDVPMCDYLHEIDEWYHAKILEIPLREGVAEALSHFRDHGAKQCVVTNARKSSVLPMIENKGLMGFFEFAWCKEDYPNRKPHPAPYLTAYDKMCEIAGCAIDKAECLAIEDDPYGVTAAAAAGIPVLHRRLHDHIPPAPEAIESVFSKEDFLKLLKGSI